MKIVSKICQTCAYFSSPFLKSTLGWMRCFTHIRCITIHALDRVNSSFRSDVDIFYFDYWSYSLFLKSLSLFWYQDMNIFRCLLWFNYWVIIITIILSCRQHGYSWLSLATFPSERSSELNSESSQSYCIYVLAGRPGFARPYVGIHRSTLLMSSSLLLQ